MAKSIQLGGERLGALQLDDQYSALAVASQRVKKSVIVADGGTKSAALDCGESGVLVGYSFPAGLDGTSLSFEVSHDNVTFQALENEDGAIALTIAASKSYGLDNPSRFMAWRYVKFVVAEQTGALTIDAVVTAV